MKPHGGKKLNCILAALLVLAAAVLAIILFVRSGDSNAISPDNYIRSESSAAKRQPASSSDASLELFRGSTTEQFAFSVDNMFPGDAVRKSFTVNVSHKGSVRLYFSASLQDGTDPTLADGLYISVTSSGRVLYDGAFSALPGPLVCTLPAHSKTTGELVPYLINVYLPTSAGNEFQNKLLTADLKWWVEDADSGSLNPWVTNPDTGKPDLPKTVLDRLGSIAQTGDTFPLIPLCLICFAALAGLFILILLSRKDDKHERKP